ncbi:MAG: DUF2703 domain-containing protein [Chloroflexi bacterium]|nr:DUF2703 domain-containing protein [Chloroflexota bacterium]
MKIEILWIRDCPNYKQFAEITREIARAQNIAAEIDLIEVRDHADARAQKFLGSPTIRINGVDPFALESQNNFAWQCRLYLTPQCLRGMPTKEMLEKVLRQAA